MNSCQLVTFVSTLSCIISDIVTPNELNLLAALFTQLGDSLATISINNSIICTNEEEKSNTYNMNAN